MTTSKEKHDALPDVYKKMIDLAHAYYVQGLITAVEGIRRLNNSDSDEGILKCIEAIHVMIKKADTVEIKHFLGEALAKTQE